METIIETIKAILPELGLAGGSAFIAWFFARRKNNAEIAGAEIDNVDKAVEIWRKLSEKLKSELDDIHKQATKLRQEVDQLRIQNNDLLTMVNKLKSELDER